MLSMNATATWSTISLKMWFYHGFEGGWYVDQAEGHAGVFVQTVFAAEGRLPPYPNQVVPVR